MYLFTFLPLAFCDSPVADCSEVGMACSRFTSTVELLTGDPPETLD